MMFWLLTGLALVASAALIVWAASFAAKAIASADEDDYEEW